jgi:hypothetical protein
MGLEVSAGVLAGNGKILRMTLLELFSLIYLGSLSYAEGIAAL